MLPDVAQSFSVSQEIEMKGNELASLLTTTLMEGKQSCNLRRLLFIVTNK